MQMALTSDRPKGLPDPCAALKRNDRRTQDHAAAHIRPFPQRQQIALHDLEMPLSTDSDAPRISVTVYQITARNLAPKLPKQLTPGRPIPPLGFRARARTREAEGMKRGLR